MRYEPADDDFEDDDFGDVDEHTLPSEPAGTFPNDKRHQNSNLNINAGRHDGGGISPMTDNSQMRQRARGGPQFDPNTGGS